MQDMRKHPAEERAGAESVAEEERRRMGRVRDLTDAAAEHLGKVALGRGGVQYGRRLCKPTAGHVKMECASVALEYARGVASFGVSGRRWQNRNARRSVIVLHNAASRNVSEVEASSVLEAKLQCKAHGGQENDERRKQEKKKYADPTHCDKQCYAKHLAGS